MTQATLSALLLLAGGLLHSFSLMCRRLPPGRRPRVYPQNSIAQWMIDLVWTALFFSGIALAVALSPWLGLAAAVIYFVVLPFVFQPALAQMFGFQNLRDYLETVEQG